MFIPSWVAPVCIPPSPIVVSPIKFFSPRPRFAMSEPTTAIHAGEFLFECSGQQHPAKRLEIFFVDRRFRLGFLLWARRLQHRTIVANIRAAAQKIFDASVHVVSGESRLPACSFRPLAEKVSKPALLDQCLSPARCRRRQAAACA